MAIRFVEDSNEIRTAKDAEHFVHIDSGRAVYPTGRTKRVHGGFAVEVFSMDGRPSSMFSTGASSRTTGEFPSTRDVPDIFPDRAEFDAIPGIEPEGEVMDANRKRERFRVVSVNGEKAVIAYRSDNFRFTVNSRQPEFLGNGKTILLEACARPSRRAWLGSAMV